MKLSFNCRVLSVRRSGIALIVLSLGLVGLGFASRAHWTYAGIVGIVLGTILLFFKNSFVVFRARRNVKERIDRVLSVSGLSYTEEENTVQVPPANTTLRLHGDGPVLLQIESVETDQQRYLTTTILKYQRHDI